MKPEALAALFRQLASAHRGGLALQDALAILAKDPELSRSEAALIAALGAQLAAGQPLSSALESRAGLFAAEAVALVRAAEAQQALAIALDLLAADYEMRALQSNALHGALAYPAAIAMVLLVVLTVVMVFVVPAFKEVFGNFGADLPAATTMLIGVADATALWIVVAVLAVVVVVLAWSGIAFPGRAWLERGLLRLPFVRAYVVKSFVARVSRTLGAAAEGRLPLASALAYLRATVRNRPLRDSAAALEDQVRAGKTLAAAVRESPYLSGQLAVALELGERSNNLVPPLRQMVAFSEGDAARSLMRLQLATIISTYVILGLLVAFVVVALYLPIFKMGQAV